MTEFDFRCDIIHVPPGTYRAVWRFGYVSKEASPSPLKLPAIHLMACPYITKDRSAEQHIDWREWNNVLGWSKAPDKPRSQTIDWDAFENYLEQPEVSYSFMPQPIGMKRVDIAFPREQPTTSGAFDRCKAPIGNYPLELLSNGSYGAMFKWFQEFKVDTTGNACLVLGHDLMFIWALLLFHGVELIRIGH